MQGLRHSEHQTSTSAPQSLRAAGGGGVLQRYRGAMHLLWHLRDSQGMAQSTAWALSGSNTGCGYLEPWEGWCSHTMPC